MLKISIWIEDENLDYQARASSIPSIELAEEKFGLMVRNYERRVAMELKDDTVI